MIRNIGERLGCVVTTPIGIAGSLSRSSTRKVPMILASAGVASTSAKCAPMHTCGPPPNGKYAKRWVATHPACTVTARRHSDLARAFRADAAATAQLEPNLRLNWDASMAAARDLLPAMLFFSHTRVGVRIRLQRFHPFPRLLDAGRCGQLIKFPCHLGVPADAICLQ